MSKTLAAILLAATLAGGIATPAAARHYGYHHHWRHWHHGHHWRGHCGWHHGRRWCR